MAGDQSHIDTGVMRTAAEDISSTGQGVGREEGVVQAFVQNLETTWTGESAQKFNQAMQGYYELCERIKNELANLSHFVLNAANDYDRTHHTANDEAAGLASAMANSSPGLKNF